MGIPIFINNRNLLTWPKKMLDKIKTFDGVGDIYIIDNGSTYEPLLAWYETKPCEIIKLGNLGHEAVWKCGVLDKIDSEYYVVTDPDLGLENIPTNALLYLKERMDKYKLDKIGFGLEYNNVRIDSPYYQHLYLYEKERWFQSNRYDNTYFDVAIDTTFALYSKKKYFIGGASVGRPYVAKHYPWYLTYSDIEKNDEFKYYLNHANISSSYKSLISNENN